ncbi:hypothetical protein As57867_010361, partial [Aphanomyces stellatus]
MKSQLLIAGILILSAMPTVDAKKRRTTPAPTPVPARQCSRLDDIDYDGYDLDQSFQEDPTDCCADCQATPGCKLYNWFDGVCYLKSRKGRSSYLGGSVSGVVLPSSSKPTPSPTPSPTPKPTPSPTPKPTPSATPEPTPSPTPKSTPSPTPKPTPSPTPEPTPSPTPKPTPSPTPEPTPSPTPKPTPSPTPEPTPSPTPKP